VLFIPLIGILVYLIARGSKDAAAGGAGGPPAGRDLRAYVQDAADSQSSTEQLAKLSDLRDRGVITAEEFEREKAKVLAHLNGARPGMPSPGCPQHPRPA
jgi:hypothetical protein